MPTWHLPHECKMRHEQIKVARIILQLFFHHGALRICCGLKLNFKRSCPIHKTSVLPGPAFSTSREIKWQKRAGAAQHTTGSKCGLIDLVFAQSFQALSFFVATQAQPLMASTLAAI